MIASDKAAGIPGRVESFSYVSKLSSQDELNELIAKLSYNFDYRHNKISLINRSRRLIGDFLKIPTKIEKTLKATNAKDFVNEYFSFTMDNGSDIVFDIKTNKAFLQNFSIGSGVTLPALNNSVEKMGTFVDLKTKLMIRDYFWDLITASKDCAYDCSIYPDEYIFRFLDRTSKTTVEFTIFK
jgi:hypothetical protein